MTKINHPDYTSVASSEQPEPPVVQGFVVGDNYVQVTVDKKNEKKKWYSNSKNSRSFGLENDPFFHKSRKPMTLAFCPNCSAENVRTRTVSYPSAVTWVCVAVGAVTCFPICWVPLVVDTMKQTDHYCQICNQKLAQIKPLEGCCIKEQA